MKLNYKYVGLDVHKERNEVAIADSSGEVRLYGSISNDLHAQVQKVSALHTALCPPVAAKDKVSLFFGGGDWAMEKAKVDRPGWFPQWAERLPQLRLPALQQQQYRFALIQYLRFCKQTRQQATVSSAHALMQEVADHRQQAVSPLATWREALNWFFREGGKQSAAPPAARADRSRRFIPKPDTLAVVGLL